MRSSLHIFSYLGIPATAEISTSHTTGKSHPAALMVLVRVESRFVGAFIFFFLDVTTAWCICRSLQVMQGFYIYWRAKQGAIVPLARSRIPLISGELLQGMTRLPSIFVIINGLCLLYCSSGHSALMVRRDRGTFLSISPT